VSPSPYWGAGALQHRRLPADGRLELLDQAGLADPGRAGHHRQAAAARGGGLLHGTDEQPELGVAADHRHVQVAGLAGDVRPHPQQPEGGHRPALALQLERRHRLHRGRVADQPPGALADQHLAGSGRLLQAGGEVDGVADEDVLAADRVADHHLAGVDAGAHLQPYAPVRVQLQVELRERLTQLGRAAYRPQRVVLVQPRDAVDGHHGVADELGDGAAVAGEHLGGLVVVAGDHLPEQLGIQPLAQPGGADQVAEDDGDGLAGLRALAGGGQRRPAAEAEAGPRRVLLTARAADQHGQRVSDRPGSA